MPKNLLNNTDLLFQIRSKTTTGAEALYDQYAQVLRLSIFCIIKQKHLTDIILQQTICQMWHTADQYNEHELSLLAWGRAIAKKLAMDCQLENFPLSA